MRFSPAIAHLLRERRGEINISLDSGSPEIYQKVKGVDGFSTVWKNLGQYVAEAHDIQQITIKYIIFEANNSIPEITNDFREVNGKGPSEKTLVAAAFFRSRAAELRLECSPFFLPPKYLKAINALQKRHFPAR